MLTRIIGGVIGSVVLPTESDDLLGFIRPRTSAAGFSAYQPPRAAGMKQTSAWVADQIICETNMGGFVAADSELSFSTERGLCKQA